MQCTNEVIRAFSFKQLCEQSDTNLRQYLGKPLITKQTKADVENHSTDYYTNDLLDNLGLDDSSNDSDDSFKEDFGLLETPVDPSDEKSIAQRQLLKAAKMQKYKLSKKKLLAKNGKTSKYITLKHLYLHVYKEYAIELSPKNISYDKYYSFYSYLKFTKIGSGSIYLVPIFL